MKIRGKYNRDSNFITCFAGSRMYTIPVNAPEDWDFREVGSTLASGHTLTRELFDAWADECPDFGTFNLEEL